MKLFWGPHTCAIGIHVLLEELGASYETEKVDVSGRETHRPEFKSINPKGKVPTLVRDDGSVLTEFGAIATWLAFTYPEKEFLPADSEGLARVLEMVCYIEGTLHGQGFARICVPHQFEPQDFVHQSMGVGKYAVVEQGKKIAQEAFDLLDSQWRGGQFAWGERLTIADTTLFYAERWAPDQHLQLPPRLDAHLKMMKDRPAVQKVLRLWGED